MRRFLSSDPEPPTLKHLSPLVAYTHAHRTVRSASRHWASQTQSHRGLQSCPCVCANGASRPTTIHSLTEATRLSSLFGTLKLPLRPSSKYHHHHHPNLKAPAPRNGNAVLSCSLESFGEQKMCVCIDSCRILPHAIRACFLDWAQVANDSLSLRQPVHNTCLTYISTTSQQLLAGTQRGDVRRYDTRVARKPVAEWKQIVPTGGNSGIGGVEKGFHEQYARHDSVICPFLMRDLSSEVFVSDQTTNLFAVDMRKGRVIYGYKSNYLPSWYVRRC